MTGLVAVWQIFAASFILGALHAINMPTRLAMVVNLVEREDIMNAVVLNAAVMNAGRIIGPAVAGFIIDLTDHWPGPVRQRQLATWPPPACVLLIRNFKSRTRPDTPYRQYPACDCARRSDLLPAKTPLVFTIIGMGFAFGFFGMPHIQVMPAFAREVLNSHRRHRPGLLITAAGVGSLAANVVAGNAGQLPAQEPAAHRLAAAVRGGPVRLFLVALVLAFLGHSAVRGHGQHRLHLPGHHRACNCPCPRSYKGRVMSLWYVSAGFMFIGSLPMALVADLVSWPIALAGGATICFAFTLGLAIVRPTLRRLEV